MQIISEGATITIENILKLYIGKVAAMLWLLKVPMVLSSIPDWDICYLGVTKMLNFKVLKLLGTLYLKMAKIQPPDTVKVYSNPIWRPTRK